MLERVQRLSDAGNDAAVVAQLGTMPVSDLEGSPTLALLFGIAQGRLGRASSGRQWVATALEVSRQRGDASIEARSLNVAGALAFEAGHIDEAHGHLTQGLAEAQRRGDQATVGRCSNNLGIIANLRGDYDVAIGSYTIAIAAFGQAGHRRGVAEALHDMAITYRDQRALMKALETEEQALIEARGVGAVGLTGLIHAGRGEIRLRGGEAEVARVEAQRALTIHREIGDVAGEAEDQRVLAGALELLREASKAEAMLRDVSVRAARLERPLLAAEADRDLARLLHRQHRDAEAAPLARAARDRFRRLGAVVEARRLEALLGEMTA